MLVVAVVGFLIVLAALFLVNLGGYSERDICKLSVLSRATAPSAVQAAVPLKCKTAKTCLTESYFGGGCKEQFAGEENVEYVRLSGNIENKRRQIEEASANAMYDCWSMMGEGKLDLFANVPAMVGAVPTQTTCIVCSRVAIDKEVIKKNPDILTEFKKDINGDPVKDSNGKPIAIGGVDINTYMKTHQVPGSSLTYLQTFTDKSVSSYASVKSDFKLEDIVKYNEQLNKDNELGTASTSELARMGEDINKVTITSQEPNTELAFVFMQIKPDSVGEVITNMAIAGGTVGAATFMTPGLGNVLSFIGRRVIFTPWGAIAAVVVGAGAVSYGAYNAYQGQLTAAGYCGEFSTSEEGKQGCSMVQGLNYNFKEVNNLCKSIQGEL
jgi:hypothetical protein